MVCERCGIKIVCKADVCPLCHAQVSGGENLTTAFPKEKKRRPMRDIPFTILYFVASLAILLIMGILTVALPLNGAYWIITAGGLIYLYYWIRITVLSFRHFNMKIFGQTAALTALGIVLESATGVNMHIFEAILPVIYIVAILVVFINITLNINNARSYLVSFMFIAILGIAPLVAYFFERFIFWPSIMVASVSAITLTLLLIIARKKLYEEFKRIFHR